MFAALDACIVQTDRDPLDDFINVPGSDIDPIEHWTNLTAKPNAKHITLTQAAAPMALDFRSAPATSTDVERLLSHGGLVVAKWRHNLTVQNIRSSTVLGNWLSVGVVPVEEVCRALDMKYGKKGDDSSDSEWTDLTLELHNYIYVSVLVSYLQRSFIASFCSLFYHMIRRFLPYN